MENYNKLRTQLNTKKERLFREKNVAKWELQADQLRVAQDTIHDAEKAFAIMLPKET